MDTLVAYRSSDLSRKERHRVHAYKEIYSSELSYFTSLQTLNTAFMAPLQVIVVVHIIYL